jgi:hypothetical protein
MLVAVTLGSACQTTDPGQTPEGFNQNESAQTQQALPKVMSAQKVSVGEPDRRMVGLVAGTSYGPGSGLRLISNTPDVVRFLYVTDRGPNTDGPQVTVAALGDQKLESKIFQVPQYAPRFGVLEWRPGQNTAQVVTDQALVQDGRPMSGLPLPQGALGFTGEAGLDTAGQLLTTDLSGIDPEGIDQDADGNLYICEEYRPSILKVDQATGRVKDIWTPGSGLPESFRNRRPNRGLEGLAVTPSGDVVAALQSTISLKGPAGSGLDTKKTAPFIRAMRRNVRSGTVTEFAIPLLDRFKDNGEAKVGDLVALSEDSFLMITQGKLKDGTFGSFIDKLETKGACDLTAVQTPDGRPLEFVPSLAALADLCTPARVTQLVRLEDFGWTHSKAEGLALVDKHTVAVINDNDFGVGDEGPDAQTTLLVVAFDSPLAPEEP